MLVTVDCCGYQLCISTRLLSVRVNSLICVGKLMDHLDKWQVGWTEPWTTLTSGR